jgi:hypothetical protein
MALLEALRARVESADFKQAYRQHEQDFTRERLLPFTVMVVSHLKIMSRSLSVAVSSWVSSAWGWWADCSKQAYSRQRQKLKHEAFIALNADLIQGFYADEQLLTWQGYLLLAVDGSRPQLPSSPALEACFGLAEKQGNSMVMAQSSVLYDVENQLVLQAQLAAYTTSEGAQLQQHLPQVKAVQNQGQHPVLLLDRGYPSLALLTQLDGLGLGFLMRCSANFSEEVIAFAASAALEQVRAWPLLKGARRWNVALQAQLQGGQHQVVVRMLKVALASGEWEYLLTNLPSSLSYAQLAALYFKRWNVEEHFDFQKSYLQMENFSSKTVEGLRQDYHAKILTSNIRPLLVADASEQLQQRPARKPRKHRYQLNQAVALGLVVEALPNCSLARLLSQKSIKDSLKRYSVGQIPSGSTEPSRESESSDISFPSTEGLYYE